MVKTSPDDSIENSMVLALEWQEQHPIYSLDPTDWTNGAYYTGVVKAHQATNNQVFLAALKNMGHKNEWKTCFRYYHADDIAISYSYLYINKLRKHLVDLKPTDNFISDHLYKDHEWKQGSDEGDKKILWWWCDALFMAPPVLVEYANLKNDRIYLDSMHQYYMQTYQLLYDKKEHLFARDLRFKWTGKDTDLKEKNGKKIFWSRGNGWVIAGLALIIEGMPVGYEHRPFYVNLFQEMASKIKETQPKDGLWRTSLLSPESFNHGEVSGSGFFTFALAWGVNNGLLDKETYLPTINKAWKALRSCQQENGKIGWVQNIGASPEPASKDSWQNFGTGAYLLAGSEVLKLK
ncbi:glycoside hydrolase family 88/105 protein [Aestuariibaculum suncheonense]|nr:glycoside hydrolase family 88 protein [Aestuariibaculum suncheonense]